MTELVYDLTFTGTLSDTVPHVFDECTLSRSNGATVVRCAVTDQDALHGLIDRIYRLDVELVAIHKVTQ
jgi:hypothetical protein